MQVNLPEGGDVLLKEEGKGDQIDVKGGKKEGQKEKQKNELNLKEDIAKYLISVVKNYTSEQVCIYWYIWEPLHDEQKG